ncbi:MAG: PQQ-binding-like beta-propeller repeat protein, partial [Thermoplasmata archaeon]
MKRETVSLLVLILMIGSFSPVLSGMSSQEDDTQTQLADSPWPNFGGDERNTRRSPYNTSHIDGTTSWATGELSHHEGGATIVGDGNALIGENGTIYFQTMFYLRAVNPDGTEKWECRIISQDSVRDKLQSGAPVIGEDGAIYTGTATGKFHAIDPNGTIEWTFETETPIGHSPNIGHDGTIYFTSENALYALNPDGTQRWNYSSGSFPLTRASPAIGEDGTIYVDHLAFYPNGSVKWDVPARASLAPAVDEDGTIYLASNEVLTAVQPNGTVKWRYSSNEDIFSAPAIGKDGTIYLATSNDFRAINRNGTLRWKHSEGSYYENSPATGGDGTIYIASMHGKFYAFNENGTIQWEKHIDEGSKPYRYRSPVIDSNGRVYIQQNKGGLLIFGYEGPEYNDDTSILPGFTTLSILLSF